MSGEVEKPPFAREMTALRSRRPKFKIRDEQVQPPQVRLHIEMANEGDLCIQRDADCTRIFIPCRDVRTFALWLIDNWPPETQAF